MSALFPRWTNTLAKVGVVLVAALLAGSIGGLMLYVRTPLFTEQYNPVEQPVEFDHRHHVADDGIDCRYCHTTVEISSTAGYPSTATCMNCHAQVWNKSPLLDPVRAAWFSDRPIPWKRVHRLPDFVFFNHAIHVAKGVGCRTCHGRIDEMERVFQAAPMTMGWCLECHRNPERYVRPRAQVTSMEWTPPGGESGQLALGRKLVAEYGVHTRTSCTTCHR